VVEIGDDGHHHQPRVRQLAQGIGERLELPLPRKGDTPYTQASGFSLSTFPVYDGRPAPSLRR
jgi:hypothetical protein